MGRQGRGEGGGSEEMKDIRKRKKKWMRKKGKGMMLTSFYPALSQTPWTMVTTMHPSLSFPG